MPNDRITSFGVYDTKKCGLVYIGLHASEDDAWQLFLGWPSEAEISEAKKNGLQVLGLTVQYEPRKAL